MIWRCRLDSSTTSKSTMPSVPTPAAARYSSAGEPRPPAPTTSTLAFFSRFCPVIPTSGMIRWRRVAADLVDGQLGGGLHQGWQGHGHSFVLVSRRSGRAGRSRPHRVPTRCTRIVFPVHVPCAAPAHPRLSRYPGPAAAWLPGSRLLRGHPRGGEASAVTTTGDQRPRSARMPRSARRAQLLESALGGLRRAGLPRRGDGRHRRAGRGLQAGAVPALPRQARPLPRPARPLLRHGHRRVPRGAGRPPTTTSSG